MTRDEIIKMAREVGTPYVNRHHPGVTSFGFTEDALQRFVTAVAAAEREACAKVCDKSVYELLVQQDRKDLIELAVGLRDAIRARGAA